MNHTKDHASEAPEFYRDSVPGLEAAHTQQPAGWPQQQKFYVPRDDSKEVYTQQTAPYFLGTSAEKGSNNKPATPRRIAGLPVWAFWLLVGVIALVIVGASVGGAVGGVASENEKDSSSEKATATSSSMPSSITSVLTAPTDIIPANTTSANTTSTSTVAGEFNLPSVAPGISDCPATNGTSYEAPYGDQQNPSGSFNYFTKKCGFDSNTANIADAYVPTFDHCITMCSDWNVNYYLTGTAKYECTAAVFSSGNGSASSYSYANCWLKNASEPFWRGDRDTAVLYLLN